MKILKKHIHMDEPIIKNPDSTVTDKLQKLRHGLIFILSSPSGAGKTTLCKKLLQRQKGKAQLSVSVTTRPPRINEVDGIDYKFICEKEFFAMQKSDKLLEWAKVFDYYYGSPKADVADNIKKGIDVIFDIDWQGAQQIAAKNKVDVVRLFILPPSRKILSQRLKQRASDSKDVIARRMSESATEVSHYHEYDYVIINEDIENSITQVEAILQAERNKRCRQQGLDDFVAQLIGQFD